MLAAYFCHSRESQVKYNGTLITVDGLAAWIALIVVGAVIVIFFWRWRTICSFPANGKQWPMPKKCPKPC
jgi:hypothetical protein